MQTRAEIAVRKLMTPRNAKRFARMRRILLEQVVFFLLESGHARKAIQADLDEIMALPPGTKPKTKAPVLPLESMAYAEILSEWANDSKYADSSGMPMLLPFRTRDPERPSFVRLCKSRYRRISPEAVLEHLILYAAVARTGPNELKLTESYLRLNRDDTESAIYSVMLLADVLHTMTLNRRDRRRLFQRTAIVQRLDAEYAPTLTRLVADQGMVFLEGFDQRMTQHEVPIDPEANSGDRESRKKSVRAAVGLWMSVG